MDTKKYGNVAVDKLHLVRVQNGLEGCRLEDGDLIITRNTSTTDELSMRNTVHFTLNAVVRNHAYGKFDSLYALITPFEQTAQKNPNLLAGLNPSDTFFHQNENGEMRLHKPILVAPNNAELPQELIQGGLSIIRYEAPTEVNEQTLAMTRNLAIANVFSALNAPMNNIGMWGWSDPNATVFNGQHRELLNQLGYNESDISTSHTGSPEDQVETAMGAFAYHNKAILNGERLESTSTGLQIPHSDLVNIARDRMKEALSQIKNEDVKQRLNDKFDSIDQDFQSKIQLYQAAQNEVPAIEEALPSTPPPIPDWMDTTGVIPPSLLEPVDLSATDVHKMNSFFDQGGIIDKVDKDINDLLSAPGAIAGHEINHLVDSSHYNNSKFRLQESLANLKNQVDDPDLNNDLESIGEAYNDVKSEFSVFNEHYLDLIHHVPHENQDDNLKYHLDLNKNLFDLTNEILSSDKDSVNTNGIENAYLNDFKDFKNESLKAIEKSLEIRQPNINPSLDNSREFDLN